MKNKKHIHEEMPNQRAFTICKKCGAGAMSQYICKICKKTYCNKCIKLK